jgi:hypothetical protein
MAFFRKRALSPVERFENALKEKQAARENLAERLKSAEAALGERRDAAERLAIASAADAQLDRAETDMRAAEDRAKILSAAMAQLDEQTITIERELAAMVRPFFCPVAENLAEWNFYATRNH